ncbi:hypothetical protein [Ammoniphilus resinae]|uniref:YpfN family protein n=1 Tax=Ammoniphilus resinae TaxID=861532 RepID=A0ABS4GN14_9BACL|nr:hypothetical protein [Ammoniphilus resinae]MBP1931447.1 hypothetical protein [Ammoniphilus resinae]
METQKPFWKKWWFWAIVILFILINLWVNQGKQDMPQQLPSNDERIGTH